LRTFNPPRKRQAIWRKHMREMTAAMQTSGRCRVVGHDRIALCWGASTDFLAWSDVVSVRSIRNCALIVARNRSIKVRSPLRAVVAEFAMLGLIQIRRDLAVNQTHVRRLIGTGRHRLVLTLDDDSEIEVGREFQRLIRARFAPGAALLAFRRPEPEMTANV
jgi:DNA-binding LytR/AlgR family response regulator